MLSLGREGFGPTRPLPSLETKFFINKGLSETVQVYVPEIFLNFFRNLTSPFPDKEMRNMDKINKYEQNNHNARGANGRERRTKPDLRARSGRYARTISPRAKTPAVQILTISNVPSDVLDAIDELAAGQDRSRSSFVRRELQRIVAGYRAKAA
jgi:Ribbon-helix-helix protein, copG family